MAVAVVVEAEAFVDGLVLVVGDIDDKVAGVLTLAVELRVDAVFD